jgi:hypothetical protein
MALGTPPYRRRNPAMSARVGGGRVLGGIRLGFWVRGGRTVGLRRVPRGWRNRGRLPAAATVVHRRRVFCGRDRRGWQSAHRYPWEGTRRVRAAIGHAGSAARPGVRRRLAALRAKARRVSWCAKASAAAESGRMLKRTGASASRWQPVPDGPDSGFPLDLPN